MYNLQQHYKYLTKKHLPNPAYYYNIPKTPFDFTDTYFRTPDTKQALLNQEHYQNINNVVEYRAKKEAFVDEILKENRKKLDKIFKEDIPVEEVFREENRKEIIKRNKSKRKSRKSRSQACVSPDDVEIALPTSRVPHCDLATNQENQSYVPPNVLSGDDYLIDSEETIIDRDQVENQEGFPNRSENNGIVTTEDRRSVTFVESPENNNRVTFINIENPSKMSTVEPFIPPPNAVSRIQEKQELQDLNDRLAQYIQVRRCFFHNKLP